MPSNGYDFRAGICLPSALFRITSRAGDRFTKLPLYMQKAAEPIFINRLETVVRQRMSGCPIVGQFLSKF